MSHDEEEDDRTYTVVVNPEEQYSIWFADRELPNGWREAGKQGTRRECLAHIATVWTDMRPKSLREALEGAADAPLPAEEQAAPRHPLGKNELVERLEALQPVEARARPQTTAQRLKEQIDRGVVFMRFANTGTEIGVRLDRDASDLASADFQAGTGVAKLVGEAVLNYNKVRYVGEVDLTTLQGTGRLEFIQALEPLQS